MRADRLLSLLWILQSRRKVKAPELARRLGVSTRTVYRDVDALASAGVPVWSEPGPAGGIGLVEGWQARLPGVSEEEAKALAVAAAGGALAQMGLAAPLRTGLAKLAASLPAVPQVAAEHARERLLVDTSPWFGEAEEAPRLAELREAVWNDRRLRIDYRGSGTFRTVDPYGLVAKIDRWYLVAETAKGMRVFRASRIVRAEILDQAFERRRGFDLEAFWRRWCREFAERPPRYPVRLAMSPQAESSLCEVSWMWPEPPRDRESPDADRTRVGTVDLQRPEIALATLLPRAHGVEVLEPAELRRRLAEVATRIAGLYP